MSPFQRVTAVTLSLMCLAGLATRLSGSLLVAEAGVVLLLLFIVVGQPLVSLRERFLVTVALILTALAFHQLDDPTPTMWTALKQSSFLAAFMVIIGVLRVAAATSDAVDAMGRYVIRQPPSRRYFAITTGAAGMASIANVGALSLLAPLIQAGLKAAREAGDTPAINAIKARRQYTATLRGFAVIIMFSPTTVTQAILITLFPGAVQWVVVAFGFVLAIIWITIGWAEDLIQGKIVLRGLRSSGGLPQRRPPLPLPRRAARDLSLVVCGLVGSAVVVMSLLSVPIVPALMLVAPLLTVIWIITQSIDLPPADRLTTIGSRVGEIFTRSMPRSAPEAVTLASASYIGAMLGALLPSDVLSWTLELGPAGRVAFLAAIPLVIILLAQVALTPIVTAVCLASSFETLGDMPVSPVTIIMALSVGWALSLTTSVFTVAPLILSRLTGVPPRTLSWGWNWAYNIAIYVASMSYIGAIELLI